MGFRILDLPPARSTLEAMERHPVWLSTTQVAARIGTSSEFVRREILRGRLVARVLRSPSGRAIYRVSEAELRRYLERYGR